MPIGFLFHTEDIHFTEGAEREASSRPFQSCGQGPNGKVSWCLMMCHKRNQAKTASKDRAGMMPKNQIQWLGNCKTRSSGCNEFYWIRIITADSKLAARQSEFVVLVIMAVCLLQKNYQSSFALQWSWNATEERTDKAIDEFSSGSGLLSRGMETLEMHNIRRW